MNLSPMSVWRWYAKSSAVEPSGRRKQSGRTLPFESASFEPAGNIAMYFRKFRTASSRICWTPVELYLSRTFCLIEFRASCCFSFMPSLSSNVGSPWVYFISPAFAACRRESSESAEHGMICMSGNCACSFFRFSSEPGLSILFAAIIIGFVSWRRVVVKFFRSWSVHSVRFSVWSFRKFRTCLMSSSFIFSPENCLATDFAKSFFVVCRDLVSLSQTFLKMFSYQRLSSFSSILTSSIGSPCPSCPSRFVVAEMSTIWMNMSACRRSSRNLFPSPFPSDAPFTSPATSMISTGTNRFVPLQNPVRGLHFVLSSVQRDLTRM